MRLMVKQVINNWETGLIVRWKLNDNFTELYNYKHSHTNLTLLEAITSQNISDWNSAYNNSHTHSNKSTLDSIINSWDWTKFLSDAWTYLTALTSESDPVFSQWLSSTPPLFSETDPIFNQRLIDTPPLYSFTELDPVFSQRLSNTPPLYSESDPIFWQWLINTPPLFSETDPLSLHIDQSTQQTITSGSPIFQEWVCIGTGTITITMDWLWNLVFTDGITGAKTLAQLASGWGWVSAHNLLSNLAWSEAWHSIDTDFDFLNNSAIFTAIATPGNPPANNLKIYAKISGWVTKLFMLDSAWTETARWWGSGWAVDSVFGRTGAIDAEDNDYSWAQIDKTVSDLADLATKSHTSLTDIWTNSHWDIDLHIGNITTNPHNVTASQVWAVALTWDETIWWIKTFTILPQSSAVPLYENDLVTKDYVDSYVAWLTWTYSPALSKWDNTPPIWPVTGDRYIVWTYPTWVRAGHAKTIATFGVSTWSFITPVDWNALLALDTGAQWRYMSTVSDWRQIWQARTYSASNGITMALSTIKRWWTLTWDTTITHWNYNTTFNLSGTWDFLIQDSWTTRFSVDDSWYIGLWSIPLAGVTAYLKTFSDTNKWLVLRPGTATQSANLFEVQNSIGTVITTIANTWEIWYARTLDIAPSTAIGVWVRSVQSASALIAATSNTGANKDFDTQYKSFKFTTPAVTTYIRQMIMRLNVDTLLTNPTAWITAYIYSDNAGVPGVLLATGSAIKFGAILVAPWSHYWNISYDATASTTYHIVLKYSAVPTWWTISIQAGATGTDIFAHSTNWTSRTTETGTPYYALYWRTNYAWYFSSTTSYGISANSISGYGGYFSSNNGNAVYGISPYGYWGYFSSVYNVWIYGSSTYWTSIAWTTTSGTAIYWTTTSGIWVRWLSTSGYGLYGTTTSGTAIYAQTDTGSGIYVACNSSVANTAQELLRLYRATTGTPAAGLGSYIDWEIENSAGSAIVASRWYVRTSDPTASTFKWYITLQTSINNTLADRFSIDDTGSVRVHNLTAWFVKTSATGVMSTDTNTYLTAETDPLSLHLDQSTPQTVQGRPIFDDGIQLWLTPTIGTTNIGKLYWDVDWKTPVVELEDDVKLQIGQETMAYVYNGTGSTIGQGKVVYTSGTQWWVPSISLAQWDSDTTSSILWVVTSTTIAPTEYGYVTIRGHVNNMDTSAWNLNDILYLDAATAGMLTNIKPNTGDYDTIVGRVMLKDATTGRIYINIVREYQVWVISAGAGVDFFLDDAIIIAASANNTYPVKTLLKTPNTTAEDVDSIVCNNNTVLYWEYLWNLGLWDTTIQGGVWTFDIYAWVSSATNTSSLTQNIYRSRPEAGTITIDNVVGTTARATASTGTPFETTKIDASAVLTNCSYLMLTDNTTWLYPITARTSDTVVTITVPAGYTPWTASTYQVQKKLFGVNTWEMNNVATAPLYAWLQLYSLTTVQPAFTILATDELGTKIFGVSTGSRTIYFAHNGTTRYSHFTSPLITRHNDLAWLQGGAAGEYYHLTSAELSLVGTALQEDLYRSRASTTITPKTTWDDINIDIGKAYKIWGMNALMMNVASPQTNIFIWESWNTTTTWNSNICAWYYAGHALTTGYSNSFMWYASWELATTWYNNVARWFQSLQNLSTWYENVCIGVYSWANIWARHGNLYLGNYAGMYGTNNNLLIIDNIQRNSEEEQINASIIYWEMNASPLAQYIRINGALRLRASNWKYYTGFAWWSQSWNISYTLPAVAGNWLMKNTEWTLSWDSTAYTTLPIVQAADVYTVTPVTADYTETHLDLTTRILERIIIKNNWNAVTIDMATGGSVTILDKVSIPANQMKVCVVDRFLVSWLNSDINVSSEDWNSASLTIIYQLRKLI